MPSPGQWLRSQWPIALSIILGMAAGAVVVWLYGADPINSLYVLLTGFLYYPDLVLVNASVLMLTALAFAIPLRVGFFNIGAEGGVIMGAVIAVSVAVFTGSSFAAMLASVVAGAILGGIVAFLRLKLSVNEVLSTIMFNWIIYWVGLYIVTAILADPLYPQRSVRVPEEAMLPRWPSQEVTIAGYTIYPGTLPSILLISLATTAVTWIVMYYTLPGLRYRFVGSNEQAALIRGTRVDLVKALSLTVAGALAGLAGSLIVLGFSGSVDVTLGGVRNYGFDGIGVALVGKNHPLGIIAASMFFSDLRSGSAWLQIAEGVPPELAEMVNGVIVYSIAALAGIHYILGSRPLDRILEILGLRVRRG